MIVYARADGVEADDVTDLIDPADYTVTFIGVDEEVRVTFLVGRTLDDIVTIMRATPVERLNLYTNTNFTTSMLNGDFGKQTMMVQEREYCDNRLSPKYNNNATVQDVIDTILPVLGAGQAWRKNDADTAIEVVDLPDGGLAPDDASYITFTDESATLTGSVRIQNLADELTSGMGLPAGTTVQRVVPSGNNIGLRYNTDLSAIEYYDGSWIQLDDADLTQFLMLSGGTMTGDIAMGTNQITGMGDPTLDQDAATKKYVDDQVTGVDPLTTKGDLFTYTTVNARLGVATGDGKVLQVSSGAATGLAYSTPAYPSASGSAGEVIRSDGTDNVYSTSTFADTYGASELLYSNGANAVEGLTTGNDMVLVTGGTGIPAWGTAIPTGITIADYLPLAGGTMSGDIDFDNTYTGINVAEPVNPQDIATKFYVDQTALTGTSVYAATTATLNATQAGAGVGATLTDASGTFAPFSTDGTSPPLDSNILNKDQAAAANRGIYTLTQNGDGISVPWVLTRATTYNTPAEINNTGLIVVQNGSTLAGTIWYNSTTIVTVDTTAFSYTQYGANFALKGANADITSMSGLTGALRAPTHVLDSSGNLVLQFGSTALAVNYMTITNNVAGSPPIFNSNGTDADIAVGFQSKGLGQYHFFGTATTSAAIRLYEDTDNGANYVALKAPASVGSSITFEVPSTDVANAALWSDGAGVFSLGTFANSNITSMTGLTGTIRAPTAIASSASVNVLGFDYTASAVNYVRILNNTAGSGPAIYCEGDDANITLSLQGKGTGGAAILGVSTNSNATGGQVGEFISSVIASGAPTAILNNAATNMTSISLTAGDWDVGGNLRLTSTAQTITTAAAWISTTSATIPDPSLYGIVQNVAAVMIAVSPAVPPVRISIAATTTIYISGYVLFTGGTAAMDGGIYARRVR